MNPKRRGEVPRSHVDTGPRDTREIEALAASKPALVRKVVVGVLPGLILTVISGIVAAIVAFTAMQRQAGAQDLRLDRLEEAQLRDRDTVAKLAESVSKLAENHTRLITQIEAMDAARAKFWQVDWPELSRRLDRTDSKIDGLIEVVSRRSLR